MNRVLAGPVVVGGMVLSFGTDAPDLLKIIWAAGVLGILQGAKAPLIVAAQDVDVVSETLVP